MTLQNFSQKDFLEQFWQKQHLFIGKAIPHYKPPLDADDLAGLSLEEEAESRIFIQHSEQEWEVQHGPFAEDHYSTLPEKNWTLLVQAVDHWLFEINDLKQCFRFIPDWRIDDIMISYASEGGGVGPHYDQYDVFLLQAAGTRRWKIGQDCDSSTPLVDSDVIKQIQHFEEKAEYLCKPGDILYVPPGCAHWGISESDDCMTISIGFRAPSHEQIIAQACDDTASQLDDDLRYKDEQLSAQSHPAKIETHVVEQLKQIISQHLLNDTALVKSFGKLMTQVKYPDTFSIYECETSQLIRRSDARLAYFVVGDDILLFANGECMYCPQEQELFIQYLADTEEIDCEELEEDQQKLVEALINLGVYQDAE